MDSLLANENLNVARHGAIFIITLQKPPENRLTARLCQTLIETYRWIERELTQKAEPEGAVILQGNDDRYFTTTLMKERSIRSPARMDSTRYGETPAIPGYKFIDLSAHARQLLCTLLDFPFPTICVITGHTFGGACLLTLAHDYRIMNSHRGFWCMPPVRLGLHFDGMGSLLQAKLTPSVARRVLLEGYKFTGKEAHEAGIVDFAAAPKEMRGVALALAERVKDGARMGVYSLLRNELYGEALRAFQRISYVHGRQVSRQPKVKM